MSICKFSRNLGGFADNVLGLIESTFAMRLEGLLLLSFRGVLAEPLESGQFLSIDEF